MRVALGALAWLLFVPAWANGPWQVALETPDEVVAIDRSSLQRNSDRVSFRERRSLRGGLVNAYSQRPLREVLAKRVIDCRTRRIATLSHAVFSDGDALVEHRAVHLSDAAWQPVRQDDPVFRQVCGGS
ncbi:MAG: surface-adhesin E family protein [Thiobacillus sp.]